MCWRSSQLLLSRTEVIVPVKPTFKQLTFFMIQPPAVMPYADTMTSSLKPALLRHCLYPGGKAQSSKPRLAINICFVAQATDAEDILLADEREGQPAGTSTRPALRLALPTPPREPTPDRPTPLSSLGGEVSQGQTPEAEPGPSSTTALFYNGLFKSSFDKRGMQGWLLPM